MKNEFIVGCNYWASNAGVYMWRCWDEATVESDLRQISECGIDTLRVFPLWCDFQPITRLVGSVDSEMRIGDSPLDETPEGIAGVDPVMISRFERFVILAQKYNINLLVCLINGWMSGRMFFPPAFYNSNPITNKTAVKWEIRFVKYMVERFREYKNIVAWEAGNETNVMCWMEGEKTPKDEYLVWLNTIVNTIKSVDNSRPVVAGIHGLSLDGFISPSDIAEICDVLTVHPYPAFVPHCFVDGIDTMKARLHSAAELNFYSDIGGKPCLCEEIGTLGSSLGCDESVASYIRANLNSLWANGGTGLMWWCSHDQNELDFAPYDWCCVERELGLIRNDKTLKPVALEAQAMRSFVDNTAALPERQRDAVCVLSRHQDSWAVAYGSFILSKQAGFDIRFADGMKTIPHSDIYMLPCISGDYVPKRTQNELLNRVYEEGATLYISWDGALISEIEKITGLKVTSNKERRSPAAVHFECGLDVSLSCPRRLDMQSVGAEVLAAESDLNPALSCNRYGKGKIYFLPFALEKSLVDEQGSLDCGAGQEYYKIYELIFRDSLKRRVISKSSPMFGLTEHSIDQNTCIVAAVNYGDSDAALQITLDKGWEFDNPADADINVKNGGIRLIKINKL